MTHEIEISDSSELKSLINDDTHNIVIVLFYSDLCKRCFPIIEIARNLLSEYTHLKVLKINGRTHQALKILYNVCTYPTILIFKNKELEVSLYGKDTKSRFSTIVKELLASDEEEESLI